MDPVKPHVEPPVVDTKEVEEKAAKAKEEKRDKERETVRKQVEEAAKAHDDLGKKFLKEDAEEAAKKAEKEGIVMATTSLTAGEIMDRSAALMNDPAKTDYTYAAQLIYLNMAIDELNELLEESNIPLTNEISPPLYIPVGRTQIIDLPSDLVEIQELGERPYQSQDAFIFVPRQEFLTNPPATNTILFWCWINQSVKFNPNGCLTPREVQLKYIRRPVRQARDENGLIESINASTWLMYKTAALLAMFIGENETRATALNGQAELAYERIIGISNKGKQQIMTRHRPFRASYKSRGY